MCPDSLSSTDGAGRERFYKLAAVELSMDERPEYIRHAVDVVLDAERERTRVLEEERNRLREALRTIRDVSGSRFARAIADAALSLENVSQESAAVAVEDEESTHVKYGADKRQYGGSLPGGTP